VRDMSDTRLRVLLVDDEPLANLEMRRLLSSFSDTVEIVGECGDAVAAREAIVQLSPDVIFLDIAMPEEDGMSMLASLDTAPVAVFVTAFDQHAVRAFELCAADYLLKPVNPVRLEQTVSRLLKTVDRTEANPAGSRDLLRVTDRIFLQDAKAQFWFVAIAEVKLFEVAGDGTRVVFGRGTANTTRSLRTVEQRLPRHAFARANRTQIIGLAFVRDVHPWFAGRLKVILDGGVEVIVSRRQARAFAQDMAL